MRRPGWLAPLLRLAVSGLLLWWLGRTLAGGFGELAEIRPRQLWGAAVLFAASTVLATWQWVLLLRLAGVATPTGRLHQLYWIGLFANNFLPSNVGGDAIKIADVAVQEGQLSRPFAATLLDRVIALVALISLALSAGLALGGSEPAGVPWWVLLTGLGPVVVLGSLLFSRRLGAVLVRLLSRFPLGIATRVERVLPELHAFRPHRVALLGVYLLALLVQAMRVWTHVEVARAMGIPLGTERILDLYVLVPVLGMAIVLPISFNGLGVREWVASRLFPQIGIAAPTAFALELATWLVQVAVSLVGGLLFAWQLGRGRLGRRAA